MTAEMILRVPIRIDGLYVEAAALELGLPMADFSKLPYNQSNGNPVNGDFPNLADVAFNDPLGRADGVTGNGLFFPKGLHLHWALPDALTTGHHRDHKTIFPAVPNRWLVRRLDHTGALQKSWIVESDFLHPVDNNGNPTADPPGPITAWPNNKPITFPTERLQFQGTQGAAFRYMGHSLSLSDWLQRKDGTGDYLNQDANSPYKLTALGYGEPAFAAYYPNCYSVFGFCDIDPDPATTYEYQVIGWFNEANLDLMQSDLIQSQFPPPKSTGEYYNVLPHIILNRTTLPWERTIDNSAPGSSENPKPWLALLLFDTSADKGVPEVKNITVQELLDLYGKSAPPAGTPEFVKVLPRDPNGHAGPGELMLEVGQHPSDRLTVIDVPRQLLFQILPSLAEVEFLSHVRQSVDPTDATKVTEYPVILCNRLPAPGTGAGTPVGTQSTVHLVSLEARQALFDALQPTDDHLVRFISLASWSFSTLQRNKTFTAWLKSAWCPEAQGDNCAADAVHTLRMPASSDKNTEGVLAQGYAPIRHQTRQGNHLVSWYRGPCLPGPSIAADIALPVRTSDELVRYLRNVGMFDTTYAAAWELGRLLTLRSKKVSVSLFNWKRAHAQQIRQAAHAATHLPFAPDHSIAPDFPDQVSEWFTELLRLKHVPFHYLVPREDMLPVNSLRFFHVDVNWLECLLDGAFSVGRVSSADIVQDGQARKAGKVPNAPTYSGFLLRSPVVSGWPNLEVEAYTQAIPGDDYLPEGVTPAKRLRFDRLGEDVLLCLFDGEVQTVDIHQHAETIHFGVDAGSDPTISKDYTKKLRNLDDWTLGDPTPLTWKSPDKRTLNIHDLAVIGKANNSAEFGVTMIEGVEKVRFVKSVA